MKLKRDGKDNVCCRLKPKRMKIKKEKLAENPRGNRL